MNRRACRQNSHHTLKPMVSRKMVSIGSFHHSPVTPSMATVQKLERHCLDKKCQKSKVLGVDKEETLVLGILVVVVAILDQDQEATSGGVLTDVEVDVDLGTAVMASPPKKERKYSNWPIKAV
ncbi:heterogeneous nuclear ribonucleoprotein A2/B1-like protein [Cricetulus griseus]|nr:heterogeneous nuclear ribonucleoprotein A2/B1-like protein [Cricetulus griseus]